MTNPTVAPFQVKTQRMVVITFGWRKLALPYSSDAMSAAAMFIDMVGGQGYDQCYVETDQRHLTGGENHYLVPDQKLTLSIENVVIANRHLTADDAMPASAEDGDHPAPLAVAAE